jgi:hypothetical protein
MRPPELVSFKVIEKRVVAASIDDACGEHYTAFKIRRKHKFLVQQT